MPTQRYLTGKRALDVVAAAAGLWVLAPALLGIGLLIKVDSPGPVLFGHKRVGRGGKLFTCWKFRSMVDGAGRRGPSITAGGDARVTRVGRMLRDWKLDELPQLWNVLTGEMSLVGPRPEVIEYVERFREDYDEILALRPGITDEAAILFRHEERVLQQADDPQRAYVDQILPQKIRLYKDYAKDLSLRRDLAILLRTLARIVQR